MIDVSDIFLQVKILVPNSTAGMIIGKGGNYIKQIKEQSGSYVQISQKAKELSLQERCITVVGENVYIRTPKTQKKIYNNFDLILIIVPTWYLSIIVAPKFFGFIRYVSMSHIVIVDDWRWLCYFVVMWCSTVYLTFGECYSIALTDEINTK